MDVMRAVERSQRSAVYCKPRAEVC